MIVKDLYEDVSNQKKQHEYNLEEILEHKMTKLLETNQGLRLQAEINPRHLLFVKPSQHVINLELNQENEFKLELLLLRVKLDKLTL